MTLAVLIMERFREARESIGAAYRTDPNINRARSWVGPLCRRLPSAAADYLAEKLPIAQWLPHYDYRLIGRDAVAGITVGVMLIPQGEFDKTTMFLSISLSFVFSLGEGTLLLLTMMFSGNRACLCQDCKH